MFKKVVRGKSNLFHLRHARLIQLMQAHAPDADKILDFGCGKGYASEKIQATFPRATVYMADTNDRRQVMQENTFFPIDSRRPAIDAAAGSLDLIFTSEVFEHVENLSATIEEVIRVLKKGGILLGSIPNYLHYKSKLAFLSNKLYRLEGALNSGGHINLLPRPFLKQFTATHFDLVTESGDIDMVFFPFSQALFKKPLMYFRKNARLNMLSYNYLFVMKKK